MRTRPSETFKKAVVYWTSEGQRHHPRASFTIKVPRAEAQGWEEEIEAGAVQLQMKVAPRFRDGQFDQLTALELVLKSPTYGEIRASPIRKNGGPWKVGGGGASVVSCVDGACSAFVSEDLYLKVFTTSRRSKPEEIGSRTDFGLGTTPFVATGAMDAVIGMAGGNKKTRVVLCRQGGEELDTSMLKRFDRAGYALAIRPDSVQVQDSGLLSAEFNQWLFEFVSGRVMQRDGEGWTERTQIPGLAWVSRADGRGRVLISTEDKKLHRFDPATGAHEMVGHWSVDPSEDFMLSANGEIALLFDGGDLELIDLRTGDHGKIEADESYATALSPDGRTVAVSFGRHTNIYSIQDFTHIVETVVVVTGKSDSGTPLVFSPHKLTFTDQGDALVMTSRKSSAYGVSHWLVPIQATAGMSNHWRP